MSETSPGGNGKELLTGLRVASDLLSRRSIATVAGLTFGGDRDLYAALGYKRSLSPADFRARYKRGGVAARVVEAYPHATWRGGAELVEDEDPDITTDFEETFKELQDRLNVWTMFQRTDVLAGLGRYAVLLLGAEGELEEPLERLSGPDGLLYLACYAEDEAGIEATEQDTANERFGLPTFYKLKRRGDSKTVERRVHWTRVIHVADNLLEDKVYGASRLERVWNHFDELDKVTGGGSEAFWLRVNQGLMFNVDPGIEIQQEQIDKLKEEAEEFAHQMRRTLAARGFEVEALGTDVSNFDKPVTSLISLISGATGIPQRILLGSERGELASTQDKENWNERVTDRRQSYGEPIVRDFVNRLQTAGGLPQVEEYDVRWPELADMNMQERANVADKLAGLNKKISGQPVILAEEIRDQVLGMEPIPEDVLAKIEEEKPTPPPGPPPPQEEEEPPVEVEEE